jgi:hypothetical protein
MRVAMGSRIRSALMMVYLAAALLSSGAHAAIVPARPAAKPAARKPVLPFVADDYARALAEARARQVPIFVESWAPW